MTDRALPAASGEQNGKVVALSTLIAGVAGGITVFLNGRRRKQEEPEVLAQLVANRKQDLAELKAAVEDQRHQLTGTLAKAKRRGERELKRVDTSSLTTRDLADIDWSGLSRKARKGLERARKEASKRAPANLEEGRESLMKSGEDLAKTARAIGERTAQQVSQRLPDFIESVESEVGPRARDAGQRASALAATTVETSKDAVDMLKDKIDDARPEVEELTQRAKQAAAKAPDTFAKELQKAEKALGSIAGDVQEHAGELAESVETRSRESAAAVKQGSKEGSSFLLWSGIAAGVVYFAVLNDDQRRKVREIAGTIWREAREVYADIQGGDGEFS